MLKDKTHFILSEYLPITNSKDCFLRTEMAYKKPHRKQFLTQNEKFGLAKSL